MLEIETIQAKIGVRGNGAGFVKQMSMRQFKIRKMKVWSEEIERQDAVWRILFYSV